MRIEFFAANIAIANFVIRLINKVLDVIGEKLLH
jgi:hypothetical protein